MADWRKAADYDFSKTFPPDRWAWEFLRRNPEYLKDWRAALSRFHDGTGEFKDYSEGARSDDHDDPNFYLFVEEREKWCLGVLLNPSVNEPIHLGFELDFGHMHLLKKGEAFISRGLEYPIIEFNLRLSLGPQLAVAERRLKNAYSLLKIRPQRSKNSRKLWARYLRLLDADLDGRSPKQIANALQEEEYGLDEKKVWDQLQSARKLMTPTGYLPIVRS